MLKIIICTAHLKHQESHRIVIPHAMIGELEKLTYICIPIRTYRGDLTISVTKVNAMRFNFIKLPKHRVFQFIPRYYDEEKEELEERIRNVKREHGLLEEEDDVDKARQQRAAYIKGQFQKARMKAAYSSPDAQNRRANIRLIIILCILLAVFVGGLTKLMDFTDMLLK